MAKFRKILLFLGLAIGIIIGGGILALESYIGRNLLELMNREVKASCPDCSFEAEATQVSLLTLSAIAENPRILENGESRLSFKKLKLTFGIKELSDKIIMINMLDLYNGHAEGVGPSSAIYRFIEHLIKPLSPEEDSSDRWKLRLQGLRVFDSSFSEKLSTGEFHGEGLGLLMEYGEDEVYVLHPVANSLGFRAKRGLDLDFGRIAGKLRLPEDFLELTNLSAEGDKFKGTGSLKQEYRDNSPISGDINYAFDAAFLYPPAAHMPLQGQGKLSGNSEQLALDGILKLSSPANLELSADQDLVLSNIAAEVRINFLPDFQVKLDNLKIQGAGFDIKSEAPVEITTEEIKTTLAINIEDFSFGSYRLKGIRGKLSANGELKNPKIEFSCSAEELSAHNFEFYKTNLNLNLQSNQLDINLSNYSKELGTLEIQSSISNINHEIPDLQKLDFQFKDYTFAIPEFSKLQFLKLSGQGQLKGPLDIEKISGSGNITASSRYFAGESALNGDFKLNRGIIGLQLFNTSKSLATELRLNLRRQAESNFTLRLQDFKLAEYSPNSECLEATLNANYNFISKDFENGSGQILINKIALGCEPYRTLLNVSGPLKIAQGQTELNNVSFSGGGSTLKINGTAGLKQLNLEIDGNLELKSLISLLPWADDIKGTLSSKIRISGDPASPDLYGDARISNTSFDAASYNISAEDINAKLNFDVHTLIITDLRGQVNDGQVEAGLIYDFDKLRVIQSDFSFKNIYYASPENLDLLSSGNIKLLQNESGRTELSGDITLDALTYNQRFNLQYLIKSLNESASASIFSKLQGLPDYDLNLKINANRNVFIITNIIEAELAANLQISGSSRQPLFKGEIQSLYGLINLQNSQLDLSRGSLIFAPQSNLPEVSALAETTAYSSFGEPVFIQLALSGPLNSVKAALSSDSNLNPQEILSLLTTRAALNRTIQNTARTGFYQRKDFELLPPGQTSLRNLLSKITSLDSIAVEPAYNLRSGLIEPAVVAGKKISNKMSLQGQSFLGSSNASSRFNAIYKLNHKLSLIGSVETLSQRDNTGLGIDLSYNAIEKNPFDLKISIKSELPIERKKLLEDLRINRDSRIKVEDLTSLKDSLMAWLNDSAYLTAEADVSCQAKESTCSSLFIEISKNHKFLVNQLDVLDEELPKDIIIEQIKNFTADNQEASREFRKILENEIILKLRNEGYIRSRIKSEYQITADNHAKLNIYLTKGTPISIIFKGNTIFSPRELLDSINLFQRKNPFGSNTINILVENIEKMYRQKGYLFANIDFEYLPGQGNRDLYLININEELPVNSFTSTFTGLNAADLKDLEELIKTDDENMYLRIFNPDSAVAEDIEENSRYLTAKLAEAGCANPACSASLAPATDGKIVSIDYDLVCPSKQILAGIKINNLPEDVPAPDYKEKNYSFTRTNRYFSILLEQLFASGYFQAVITTDFDYDNNLLIFNVQPGSKSLIKEVSCQGNESISCQELINLADLQSGDYYSQSEISKAEGRLLRTGLFTSASIRLSDSKLDNPSENLLINVSERALQSIEVGTGANSELGLHFFGLATDREFFHDGRTLALRFDIYYSPDVAEIEQGIAGLRYNNPALLGSEFRLSHDVGYQKYDIPTLEYDEDRSYFDSLLNRRFGSNSNISFGHTAAYEDLSNVNPGAVLSDLDTDNNLLSYLYGQFSLDLRDSPVNPTRGTLLALDYKFSAEELGSDADYYTLASKFAWHQRLGRSPFSLANNLFAGGSWTYSDTPAIPITQRFYLGGRNSIRGFRENSLGPRGDNAAIIGGDAMLGNNFELRYRVDDNIVLHSFIDTGNVFLQDQNPQYDHLRIASGLGFRFISPIGPIGFDLAHPLDEKEGEPSWRIHFSVGSAF